MSATARNAIAGLEDGTEARDARVSVVRFEHRADGLGVGADRPRLSWRVETRQPGWRQSAYEIEAREQDGSLPGRERIASAGSVLVPWPFEPLRSRQRLAVRVRVWDHERRPSAWSEPADVEAGLLSPSDWTAGFVGPDWPEDTSRAQPCPLLRHEFELRAPVVRARLYASALGVYEPWLNGEAVGDHVLAPGWTSYDHRLRYQVFDVTDRLRVGTNAIGAMLGDGWYRGRLGFNGGRRNIWGDRLALLAQLEVTYADGTTETIRTDEAWRATAGPILASDLYDGETYDARLEHGGWASPEFDDSAWAAVRAVDRDPAALVASTGPPVRRIELVEPVEIGTSPSGKTVIDFGQNLVGRLRIRVQGAAGTTVTLRHAELLEDGELCVWPLRAANATDRYTLRGGGVETWEPRFTFHGFRYAEVDGWPGELRAEDVTAVVCHSDLERTGWFECSDPLLNRLHENVVWSMRGNFLDVPTDCAQRDERLGWTGDIQIFAPTASFLYDVTGFLESWLADLVAEQAADGRVPNVVPDVIPPAASDSEHDHQAPAAGWGDAAVIVPWVLYLRAGDLGILEAHYESMRAWLGLVESLAGDDRLWQEGFQYGDWVDPTAPPERPARGRTDPHLVATAYFAHSADLLSRIAELLGREEDRARYAGLAAEVREAFAGEYHPDSATAYSLAIEFGLLADDERRARAGERLVGLVRDNGYRISTGFVGTPLICDALCSVGRHETAYRLLLERSCPSWLFPLTMGATTIWERWDALRPDGTLNPGHMNSFNHYALGAVADWMHRTIGGLAPAEPGYRKLEIRPVPGGGLTHASARHRTPYGVAAVSWRLAGGVLEVEATVPPNTTARVLLPDGREPFEVGSGTHRWTLR
jgi:alpha-L-rhamnosidase